MREVIGRLSTPNRDTQLKVIDDWEYNTKLQIITSQGPRLSRQQGADQIVLIQDAKLLLKPKQYKGGKMACNAGSLFRP